MKKALLVLIILIPLLNFSQNRKIPKFNWSDTLPNVNHYVSLLDLKDTNALIIKISNSSYWSKGEHSKLIVYLNNGKVKLFKVFEPSSIDLKPKIKSKSVSKKDYSVLWKHLKKCNKEKRFELIQSKLNIRERKVEKNGRTEILSVSDGLTYKFSLFQGKKSISYSSNSPRIFIEEQYPGWEERQKLLDLIESFEELIGKKKTN